MQNPKEEAKDMCWKFSYKIYEDDGDLPGRKAKECALVCVEKILEILPNTVNALEVHYQNVRREIELL